jgi:PAS domain S-box-containing protein
MNFNALLDRLANLLVPNGKKNWRAISAVYCVTLASVIFLFAYARDAWFMAYGSVVVFYITLVCLLLSILSRVKQSEQEHSGLAAIVESADDAIMSHTLDGTIVTWNHGAEKVFGYAAREIVDRSIRLLAPPEGGAEMDGILEAIRRGEVVENNETTWVGKDGGQIDVSLTVSPIRDAAGRIAGAAAIARDVTRRKQFRRDLEDKNRALEEQYHVVQEVNRLKSEFLANMSHELRTPLNAIIGFAQLMRDGRVGPVSENHKEYLDDILSSGRRLLELINDVLDLARIESGKMEFIAEPVEISPIVDQVRAILHKAAANKHLSIAVDISPELETLVLDAARLKQVLYNYLSNAIKFTPDGGHISIHALRENADHFRLEVRDTGIGIPAERIGELFAEFKQLDSGSNKRHQGTGLGLALTRKIVEAQGGRVGVHSSAGEGSVFFAVLPRRAVGSRDNLPTQIDIHTLPGPRILVVEDDKNDVNWLRQTLSHHGYAVDLATTGAEAMIKAAATSYSAILLDLILPDALGWNVLNSIRNTEKNQHAPVIVITAATEKATAKSFALQDYLPKPVSPSALLASLRRAGIIADGAGKKILVVDDDPQALKLASAALESSGYQTICHSSAASALESASQSAIDAVVLDLLMPEMDGFDFLDGLRNLANCKDTPVIVWTAKNITTAERDRLKNSTNSIALKGHGGIDSVLRELRYHITHGANVAPPERS